MIHTIEGNYIYKVNVYYSIPADNAFGEEFVDVVDKYFSCDNEDEADAIMNHYCDLYRNNKGYTVSIIPMEENNSCEGFKVIK